MAKPLSEAQPRIIEGELAQLQRDYAMLKQLHAGMNCEGYKQECINRVGAANMLRRSAEAEAEGSRLIVEAHALCNGRLELCNNTIDHLQQELSDRKGQIKQL